MAIAALSVGAACALGPWLLYGLGLDRTSRRPTVSTRVATPLEQVSIWRRAGGEGEPFVASVNPYTYWGEASASGPRTAGVLVAWRVASAHLQEDRRERGMSWWHLSGVVLTIWRTRHGTVDQILSKLVEIEAKHPA